MARIHVCAQLIGVLASHSCLLSILRKFISDAILDSGYAFSPSGTYRAPDAETRMDMHAYLEQLPMVRCNVAHRIYPTQVVELIMHATD